MPATRDRQRQRRIDAYAAEAVTLAERQTRVQALEARLADLAQEEQQLAVSAEQRAQVATVATRMETFRASLALGLEQAPFARRRELVELLIDRVLVDPPEVEIRYLIPFCRRAVTDDGATRSHTPGRPCGTTGGSSRASG
jgi:site-specific DNA recombinase